MEAETRYAKSGNLRTAYQVHGDGPVDLVFAPGRGRYELEGVPGEWHVLAVDGAGSAA